MAVQDLSIYIHYPFCKSKCPYCDFNSHVYDNIENEKFLNAYLKEIQFFVPKLTRKKITTIFFGGGTPSLMPINLVEKILDKLSKNWEIDENCEITLEANPTSFEAIKFQDFKKAGINRLSIGIQALNDFDLKFLGREHSALEAIKTIETAATIFENYSFDLIYARPLQTLRNWEKELEKAIKLSPNHLSLYQLTIEKGTKFYSQYQRGEFALPDDDLAAEFYELTNSITTNHGLDLYEISNYAKAGFECKHNLAYWKSDDYLGIGAGAHSRICINENMHNSIKALTKNKEEEAAKTTSQLPEKNYLEVLKNSKETSLDLDRTSMIMLSEPNAWLKKVEEAGIGIQNISKINKQELLEEVILMGLRLRDGINNEVFQNHFKKNITDIFDFTKLQNLINEDLICADQNNIKITDNGRLLTNIIIEKVCQFIIL